MGRSHLFPKRRIWQFGRPLTLEGLESRDLMTIAAGIDGPTTVVPFEEASFTLSATQTGSGGARPITELMGGVHIQPTGFASGLGIIRDVESGPDGTVYIAGSVDGKPAYQSFTVVNGVPVFAAVHVLPVPNASGQGLAIDIQVVGDQIVFGGMGRTNVVVPGATEGVVHALTWNLSGGYNDHGLESPTSGSIVFRIASDGTIVGEVNGDDPAVGNLAGQLHPLPFTGSSGVGLAITSDGQLIVGDDEFDGAAWKRTGGSYVEVSAFGDSPVGGKPSSLAEVYGSAAIGNVAFSEFFDLDFVPHVGAWDLNTGAFLRDVGLGELKDIMAFGDSLVLAINGPDGGYLTTLAHPDLKMPLSSLLPAGNEGATFVRGALYNGSLGFLVETTTGLMTASFNVNGGSAIVDPNTSFSYQVDWDGNGTFDETVTGRTGTVVKHTFNALGTTNVVVRATAGSETSAAVSQTVSSVAQRVENGVLKIGGTVGNDRLSLDSKGTGVVINNGRGKTAVANVQKVEVYLGPGNDTLTAKVNVPLTVWAGDGQDIVTASGPQSTIYGGAGTDLLVTGGAHDVVFGEAGDDLIMATGKRSIVVGGTGRDRMMVTDSQSLAIAGDATLSAATLDSLYAELGKRNATATSLQALLVGKVTDDNAVDSICGNAWVLLGIGDNAPKNARRLRA